MHGRYSGRVNGSHASNQGTSTCPCLRRDVHGADFHIIERLKVFQM